MLISRELPGRLPGQLHCYQVPHFVPARPKRRIRGATREDCSAAVAGTTPTRGATIRADAEAGSSWSAAVRGSSRARSSRPRLCLRCAPSGPCPRQCVGQSISPKVAMCGSVPLVSPVFQVSTRSSYSRPGNILLDQINAHFGAPWASDASSFRASGLFLSML